MCVNHETLHYYKCNSFLNKSIYEIDMYVMTIIEFEALSPLKKRRSDSFPQSTEIIF